MSMQSMAAIFQNPNTAWVMPDGTIYSVGVVPPQLQEVAGYIVRGDSPYTWGHLAESMNAGQGYWYTTLQELNGAKHAAPSMIHNILGADDLAAAAQYRNGVYANDAAHAPPPPPPPPASSSTTTGASWGGGSGTVPTGNPVLPNNTPNPSLPGTITPGGNANAQDASGGSTQSGGSGAGSWENHVINGDTGNGAGGGAIDSKLVLYGLAALVAVLAIK